MKNFYFENVGEALSDQKSSKTNWKHHFGNYQFSHAIDAIVLVRGPVIGQICRTNDVPGEGGTTSQLASVQFLLQSKIWSKLLSNYQGYLFLEVIMDIDLAIQRSKV